MPAIAINDTPPYTQIRVTSIGETIFGTNWTANYPSDVVVFYTPLGDAPDDLTQMLPYPSAYSVDFIGSSLEVQVTLSVGAANIGDIVTITRMTPSDRLNLYSNTNFTPTMLNQDFGILTLVDQQAQLVNQSIAPRYNYSAIINPNPSFPTCDTILPILPANCVWVKNPENTAIIAMTIPTGGNAPDDSTYILQVPDSSLPAAQALSELADGLLYNTFGTGVLSVIDQSSASAGDVLTFVGTDLPPVYAAPSSSGISNWQTITAPSVPVNGGDGIVANRTATFVQVELPATFNVGDMIGILGLGTGGWSVVANAGQTIVFGSETTSTAGSITSDITNANIFLRGLVANTTWTVELVNSNPTII